MKIEVVPIDSLKASTYNPRISDPERLDIIELSLKKLGFLLPIYADPTGEILSGHQRHLVATRMGLKKVPVCYTGEMELHLRKSLNIAFNRGTNDLSADDTPMKLTEAIKAKDVWNLGNALPDADEEKLFRCSRLKMVKIEDIIKANSGQWKQYQINVARTFFKHGIVLPVIARKNLEIVNGIGRVPILAEKGFKECPVVIVEDHEVAFADAMLNYLSMDFNLHERYADLLRYNSFRRDRGARKCLGRAFTFEICRNVSSKQFDVTDPKNRAYWTGQYGNRILDFGAGLLHETNILRGIGIDCVPFEPYLLTGGEIDREGAVN